MNCFTPIHMPNKSPPQPLTREQVRKDLDRRGVSIASFARANGLNQAIVYQVLSGQKKGRRGEAHRAAVLLGLKEGVITGPRLNE